MTTYIVVSDAARARVFAQSAGALQEVDTLVHPESQRHAGDLRTGGKGEVDQSVGDGRNQSDASVTTMEKHSMTFAKEVADYLYQARTQHKADEFVLVAAPKFLGDLRDKLDKPTRDLVTREIDKDLSKASETQIAETLNH
ncbi:host attachment protein [Litchfieldella xinjiangensis]|uniref:host attachment protein n=1 Tax=Litchfieldella xinjiangensis TaxID=1166948 RepID=UPI0005B9FFA1|nr:host attachment protein [Halomonas xinjiangensis]